MTWRLSKFVLVLAFATILVADAGTVWDARGNANTNWNRAQNWNPNGAPVANSNVTFGTGGSTATMNVAETVNTITFNRTANFTINGSSILTINSGLTVSGSFLYTISAPVVLGADNTWNINSGTFADSGSLTYDFKTLTVNGDSTFNSSMNMSVSSGLTYGRIVSNGNINIGAGLSSISINSTGYTATDDDRLWLVVNNSSGATSGYFASYPQGSSVSVGGKVMYWFYGADYGTGAWFGGNDILLCVPEPGSSTLVLVGFSILLLRRRNVVKKNRCIIYLC